MTISLTREGTTWDALLEQPGDIRLNEWLGTTGHREMVPNGHTAYPRGGILYPNYSPLPAPDYNTIVIPTGATRWSYGILLMSHTSTQQIITAAESSNLFTLTFSTIGKWVADDELAVERKLQLRVSVLRPYPITGRVQGPQAQLEAQTLWAVPIVDERFWWQHKYLNDVPDDLDGAQAVFDHVRVAAGGAGGVILLKPGGVTATLDDVYTQQPDISTMAGENAALVLEHICWHLGLSIAPDMLNPGKFHAIPMFSWTPGSSSTTVNADLIAANRQGNLLSPDTGGGWSETRQGYPAVMFGGALGDAPVLPATVKVQAAVGEWLEATNTTMAASGSEWQLRVTYTEATTQETADQLAEDTVARFTGGHNLVMCAVQNWQPTGCDDYVIHTQRRVNIEPHGDIGHIVSRVHPLSANVIPTLVEGGSTTTTGGGVSGCGCDCVNATNIEVNGHRTTSVMTVRIGEITEYQTDSGGTVVGHVVFVGGSFELTNTGSLSTPTDTWEYTLLSGDVRVYDSDDNDITSTVAPTGTITWQPFATPYATLTLSVTAVIP